MKVTALIPDELVNDVRSLSRGRTITESPISALSEWADQQHLKRLAGQVGKKPLRFLPGFSAEKARDINRKP
jgi:hypothetical protein